jgi:putative membrane protein
MLKLIFHTAVNVLIILLLSYLLKNFHVQGAWPAFWFLLVLTILNWTIVPVIKILTLPITILTFGIFYLVLNLTVILIVANSTSGISIDGNFLQKYLAALLISVSLALGNFFVNKVEKALLD